MHFRLSRDKGTATKGSSASGKGNEAAKPKFDFGSENLSDENDMDRHLSQENLKSLARAMIEKDGRPTARYENEDPRANKLFQDVPGYQDGLRPEGQKERADPDNYPPRGFMEGPTGQTPRVEGDDPAADQLLAGARKRQEASHPETAEVSVSKVDEGRRIRELARQTRECGMFGSNRKKGEDPAADELFQNSKRP